MLSRIITTILLFCAINTHAQPYKNLVLEGGGIRGIAYVGVLEGLMQRHMIDDIENVAGTSVGAVAGCLYAMGYTPAQMRQIMEGLRIQTFNDGRWIFFGGFARTKNRFGWYRGDAIEQWIGKQIAARTGSEHTTFAQLHDLTLHDQSYKDLYVIATNLSQQKITVFNWRNFSDMEIRTAVRASMSVPLYFSAVFLDSKGHKVSKKDKKTDHDIYVDGGILANYPIAVFDSLYDKKQTLGLKLERPEQIEVYKQQGNYLAPYKINSFRNYVGAFYNVVLEGLNKPGDLAEEAARTVYISTGNINPRVRRISKEQKQLLYENGKQAAAAFRAGQ